MIFRFIKILLLLGYATLCNAQSFERWEPEIRAFEVEDSLQSFTDGGILFLGSSSIKLWNSIVNDMSPHRIVQRGFGGSSLPDVIQYADRIISRHKPCAFVLFVANDITGTDMDKTPNQVADLYGSLINVIRKKHTDTPIFIIAITPTGSRWSVWPKIRQANAAISDVVARMNQVTFIPTEHLFLGNDGLPDPTLFISDKLHLSSEGYAKWTSVLKPLLDEALGECTGR